MNPPDETTALGTTALGTAPPAPAAAPPVAAPPAPDLSANFQWPTNWKEGLSAELRDEGSMKAIQDIPNLAKSFVAAQKMVGADKLVIPSKHATEDDWKQVFTKLGNPEKLEDYKFEVPKDAPFDAKFVGGFKEIAHKAGILPKQAEGLVKWFADASKAEAEGYTAQAKQKLDAEVQGLRTEWGAAYDAKIAKAHTAVKEFGGEGLVKFLNESGLGNSGQLIRAFAKAADLLGEDKLGTDQTLTPGDAQNQINAIFGNKDHPYHLKSHPGHKSAVQEMEQLFQQKSAGGPKLAAGAGFISFNSRS